MNLAQLKKKVKELGEVRAYWSGKESSNFGLRGYVKLGITGTDANGTDKYELAFWPDHPDHDGNRGPIFILASNQVHAPLIIGHYSW